MQRIGARLRARRPAAPALAAVLAATLPLALLAACGTAARPIALAQATQPRAGSGGRRDYRARRSGLPDVPG